MSQEYPMVLCLKNIKEWHQALHPCLIFSRSSPGPSAEYLSLSQPRQDRRWSRAMSVAPQGESMAKSKVPACCTQINPSWLVYVLLFSTCVYIYIWPKKNKRRGNCMTLQGIDLLQASCASVVPAESRPGGDAGEARRSCCAGHLSQW